MEKTEILIVSQNEEIRQSAISLINHHDLWFGTGASATEEAIEQFHRFHFEMVVLINDISEEELIKLRKIFTHQNADLILLQLDTATLGERLISGIEEAFVKQNAVKRSSYLFIDDALKNAKPDIRIQQNVESVVIQTK